MHRSRILALAFTLSAAAWAARPVSAQEDPVREAAALVKSAEPAMDRGSWEDAVRDLRKALAADPKNDDAALHLSRALEHSGKSRDAIAALAGRDESPRILLRRSELLLLTGDLDGAEKAARDALAKDDASLPARYALGIVLEQRGRFDDASALFKEMNKRWADSDGEDAPETLAVVGRARLALYRTSGEYRSDLNGVLDKFEPSIRLKKPPVEVLVDLGDVYLRNFQHERAKEWFTKAADRNPHYAPALFGKARQRAFIFEDTEAAKEAERALRENPEFVPAMVFLAQMHLGDSEYDPAEKRITAALTANPAHADARAARAALHFLRGAQGSFEGEVKSLLSQNPKASVAYRFLAEVLEEHRRFADAAAFARKATEVNPRDWDAWFLLGRNLLNVGDEAEGEKALKASEKGDPFENRYRSNFLELFRATASYPVRENGKFRVRIAPSEERAYLPLILPALDRSLAELEAKWGMPLDGQVHVSIFERQEDFAARTIGLPGFPALGACFGRVVTLDSPRALPAGAFGWRGTMHHELAHVITLELSRGRVPRWLTEGASVYEERKASPQWFREMERELVDAIASDEVLTLANVNQAFRGRRVMYAYYQGGLMCEWIEREFGFPKLRELVRAFADELDTPAAVKKALGIEPEEFDRRFLGFAKEYVKDVKVLPRPSQESVARLRSRLRKDGADADGWFTLALGQLSAGDAEGALQSVAKLVERKKDDPRALVIRSVVAQRQARPDQARKFAEDALAAGIDVFDLRMALASFAREAKDFAAAKAHLARAIELYPQVTGPGSPRIQLAGMLLGEGESNLDAAMKLLQDHCAVAEDDFATRQRLAKHYETTGCADDELRTLLEMRDVVPLPNGRNWPREQCASLHERLARIQLGRKAFAEAEVSALMAFEASFMDLGRQGEPPLVDRRRAELLALRGTALDLLGRKDEARKAAEEALRLDPESEDARDLLDRLSR
ncbi:MAG: Beta-barrel assembly-enhancing protease [Planctomycetes bacterium]|nr:Beta-barrel assembly-enhancing protease [Planctomycetota bacterium]